MQKKKKKKNLRHMCGVIEGRASRLPRHGPCSQLPPSQAIKQSAS
jgi:hypothetical protein